jgi:predicted kinase
LTHLVFFCGHAGSGKTTLAKRLIGPLMHASGHAFCLLDKDTLYGRYSSAAMEALTNDPNDRDSPLFLEHLRNPEYQGLLDTARDNLESGISALVVGPLSQEIRDGRLLDRAWLGIDRIRPTVRLSVVWVYVDEALARRRIVERNNPNDAYKLAHWDSYRQRRFMPDTQAQQGLIMFDNSAPVSDGIEMLMRRLLAHEPRSDGADGADGTEGAETQD